MTVKQKTPPKRATTEKSGTVFFCGAKPDAKVVFLVGEFNDWDTSAHRMIKRGSRFQKTLRLKPGVYQYKFLIDGEWYADPEADQVPNEFGTMNSVIRV